MNETVLPRRSTSAFVLYALPRIGLLVAIIVGSIAMFGTRYTLMVDPQDAPCIPGKHLFLVDRNDRAPERGGIYAMRVEGIAPLLEVAHPATNVMRPFYVDGKNLIKVMDGVPGDLVEVSREAVSVNGKEYAPGGLMLSGTLLKDPGEFEERYVLGTDEYFMAGRTDNSFDSRYWGPIHRDQILGRAYPLF